MLKSLTSILLLLASAPAWPDEPDEPDAPDEPGYCENGEGIEEEFWAIAVGHQTMLERIETGRVEPETRAILDAMHEAAQVGDLAPEIARDVDLYLTVARSLLADEVVAPLFAETTAEAARWLDVADAPRAEPGLARLPELAPVVGARCQRDAARGRASSGRAPIPEHACSRSSRRSIRRGSSGPSPAAICARRRRTRCRRSRSNRSYGRCSACARPRAPTPCRRCCTPACPAGSR